MTTAIPSSTPIQRRKPSVGNVSSPLSLGLDLNTAETVRLHPEDGPLLVFGSSGCGKSQTLKKLAYRLSLGLVDSRLEDAYVLVYDAHRQRYGCLVRRVGGAVLNATGLDDEPKYYGKSSPRLLTLEDCLGAGCKSRLPASHRLVANGQLLQHMNKILDSFHPGPVAHTFFDSLDDLLWSRRTSELFTGLLSKPRAPSAFYVASVTDPAPAARTPAGRKLLRDAGAILMMKNSNANEGSLLQTLRDIHPCADLNLDYYPAVDRKEGEGILLNLRGLARPTPVYVDCTGPEMALFDTKPGPQPGAAA